jgi:hypothetical protein
LKRKNAAHPLEMVLLSTRKAQEWKSEWPVAVVHFFANSKHLEILTAL